MDENIYTAWQTPAVKAELENQQKDSKQEEKSDEESSPVSESGKVDSGTAKENNQSETETKPEATKEKVDNVARGREIYDKFKGRMPGLMDKIGKFKDKIKNKLLASLGAAASGVDKVKQISDKAGSMSEQWTQRAYEINSRVGQGVYEAGKKMGEGIAESHQIISDKVKKKIVGAQALLLYQQITWNEDMLYGVPTEEKIEHDREQAHLDIDKRANEALDKRRLMQKHLEDLKANRAKLNQILGRKEA